MKNLILFFVCINVLFFVVNPYFAVNGHPFNGHPFNAIAAVINAGAVWWLLRVSFDE